MTARAPVNKKVLHHTSNEVHANFYLNSFILRTAYSLNKELTRVAIVFRFYCFEDDPSYE